MAWNSRISSFQLLHKDGLVSRWNWYNHEAFWAHKGASKKEISNRGISNNWRADTITGGKRLAALLQQSKEHPKQITKAAKVNFSKWTGFFSICILPVLVFSEILFFIILCLPRSTEEQCVCWSVLRVAEAKVKNESLKSFSVSLLILWCCDEWYFPLDSASTV